MTIDEIIRQTFIEDIGDGDHTSNACFPVESKSAATLFAKEDGVIAGLDLARRIFNHVDPDIQLQTIVNDGDQVTVGQKLFEVSGSSRSILTAERTVLNFMQRMSGIATRTHYLTQLIKPHRAKLLDTRKTTPLLREIEKWAVRIGGGHNHRMGLYDMIMIKDNHSDMAGGISKAVQKVTNYLEKHQKRIPIEVEVRDLDEVEEVLTLNGVDRVMFDNFSPQLMTKAVELVNGRLETEASGGITADTIAEYAATGVDFISVGALTHNIRSLDISLKANLNV